MLSLHGKKNIHLDEVVQLISLMESFSSTNFELEGGVTYKMPNMGVGLASVFFFFFCLHAEPPNQSSIRHTTSLQPPTRVFTT